MLRGDLPANASVLKGWLFRRPANTSRPYAGANPHAIAASPGATRRISRLRNQNPTLGPAWQQFMQAQMIPDADCGIVTNAYHPSVMKAWKRHCFTTAGVFCVAVGFVGIVLPGLPTTGPLLLASYLLTKGNPRLEKLLVRHRVFRRYLHYLDGTCSMPMKARCWAIVWMWIAICFSSLTLAFAGSGPAWLAYVCVAAGVAGTVFIWRFRRSAPCSDTAVANTQSPAAQRKSSTGLQPRLVPPRDDASLTDPTPVDGLHEVPAGRSGKRRNERTRALALPSV